MKVYTAKDVAKLLELSVGQVRSYARAGLLQPERGARGEYRFSFQDLVLLRTTKALVAARMPQRKVRRALRKLRTQLPQGRPLSGVHISASGDDVIVRDGDSIWQPESGQGLLNFDVSELARRVAPHTRQIVAQVEELEESLEAEDWYALGCDLEAAAPEQARDAYRRCLELDPYHPEGRVNLGRLLHEVRWLRAAEAQYRLALTLRPDDAVALFNLGVCLEDLERPQAAMRIYKKAIQVDPKCADAHFNLAGLCEAAGDKAAAVRHLTTYRKLTRGRDH